MRDLHIKGTWVIKKAGLSCKTGHTGAVTLIQRFGNALKVVWNDFEQKQAGPVRGVGQDARNKLEPALPPAVSGRRIHAGEIRPAGVAKVKRAHE